MQIELPRDRVQLDWPTMPKMTHEALVQLVRSAPEIVTELLRTSLGLVVPVHVRPRVTAAELTDMNFAEHRADAVLTLGEPVEEAFVIEAQGKPDPVKREVWPLARVEGCDDPDMLMLWAERVVTARRVADVFADDR